MVQASSTRSGMVLDIDNELYSVVEVQHIKPGKGGAFSRLKLKNLKTGRVVEKSFRAEEKLVDVRIERKPMQYLYYSENQYFFMDTETFEQIAVDAEIVKDVVLYLKEGDNVDILFREHVPVSIELPFFVELKVIQTDPGVRGDTASGGTKPATLETGAVVQVPLFIEEGDVLKIDTRTGEYIERV
ncbi:elongation factor P [bacterium]|nr:elongation factor P [bacterium]HDI51155.1 elongation factor P [Bacteroidota bacterium]